VQPVRSIASPLKFFGSAMWWPVLFTFSFSRLLREDWSACPSVSSTSLLWLHFYFENDRALALVLFFMNTDPKMNNSTLEIWTLLVIISPLFISLILPYTPFFHMPGAFLNAFGAIVLGAPVGIK
jgi:hypothetical protein